MVILIHSIGLATSKLFSPKNDHPKVIRTTVSLARDGLFDRN